MDCAPRSSYVICLSLIRSKDLENWKASDGMDFASCVKHVMAVTDCEHRHGPDVTLLIS